MPMAWPSWRPARRGWRKIEGTPGQDMSTLALYLRQWRLKLSEGKKVSTVFHLNNAEAKHELDVCIDAGRLDFRPATTCLGVGLGGTLSCRRRLAGLGDKVMARSALIRKLVGKRWGQVHRRSAPLPWRSCMRRMNVVPQHGVEADTPA